MISEDAAHCAFVPCFLVIGFWLLCGFIGASRRTAGPHPPGAHDSNLSGAPGSLCPGVPMCVCLPSPPDSESSALVASTLLVGGALSSVDAWPSSRFICQRGLSSLTFSACIGYVTAHPRRPAWPASVSCPRCSGGFPYPWPRKMCPGHLVPCALPPGPCRPSSWFTVVPPLLLPCVRLTQLPPLPIL